jgi:hypothetical protein
MFIPPFIQAARHAPDTQIVPFKPSFALQSVVVAQRVSVAQKPVVAVAVAARQ